MELQEWRDSRRSSFGQAADLYDRIRPGYPAAATTWALAPVADRAAGRPLRVVDLGAGTGKLTRQLRDTGHQVVAVEPDPQMRDRLAETTGGVTVEAGSAEDIPLPDGSVDAVLAGQAYHWFNPDQAHPEIARVLRPGGILAPIWNRWDEDIPWVAALAAITDTGETAASSVHSGAPELSADFGPVEQHWFSHTRPLTLPDLLDLYRSTSVYLTAPPEKQVSTIAAIRDLHAAHPALQGRETFDFPYRTVAYRAHRLG